jgi:hypothetical protein
MGAGRHEQQMAVLDGNGDAGDVAGGVETVVQRLLDGASGAFWRAAGEHRLGIEE